MQGDCNCWRIRTSNFSSCFFSTREPSGQMEPLEAPEVLTIEWEMMNKTRFVAFSVMNTLTLRCLVYPLTVVKTRLQVQTACKYSGTSDALRTIIRVEGFKSLYKGFWINSVQVVSNIGYIITYEKVRDSLQQRGVSDTRVKGLVGGGVSSLVGQTLITPFDVVSQHIMVLGRKGINPLNIPYDVQQSRFLTFKRVCSEVYKRDGFVGFYRGYFASLIAYVPGSACWWAFYPAFQGILLALAPPSTPLLFIQCVAGPLSGVTTCVITNPADIIRARIQVQRLKSWTTSLKDVWKSEGSRIFTIGLSARMLQSSFSSFCLALGYETLKRWSVSEEYKDKIKW